MSQPTDTPSTPTNARKREIFDHLIDFVHHDCLGYRYTLPYDTLYDTMTEMLGPIDKNDLEALSVIADKLANYIKDIPYHKVFA